MTSKIETLKKQERHVVQAVEKSDHDEVKRSIKNLLRSLSTNHNANITHADLSWVCKAIIRWRSFLFSTYKVLVDVSMPSATSIEIDKKRSISSIVVELATLDTNWPCQGYQAYLETGLLDQVTVLSKDHPSETLLALSQECQFVFDGGNYSFSKSVPEKKKERAPLVKIVSPLGRFKIVVISESSASVARQKSHYNKHFEADEKKGEYLLHEAACASLGKGFHQRVPEYIECHFCS